MKRVWSVSALILGVGLMPLQAQAKVCVGADQIASLVTAGSGSSQGEISPSSQPSRLNPPVMRALPAHPQYLGDGVYVPDKTRERQQSAYEASRDAIDQQPMMQTSSQGASSSGMSWGGLGSMIPSGGGKCRGICY